MNVAPPVRRDPPGPDFWRRADVRKALGARDIPALYGLLRGSGWSQQRIGAMTGQSQPEISAIIHGRRVYAYDVLARIVDGLGAPREAAGMAYGHPETDVRLRLESLRALATRTLNRHVNEGGLCLLCRGEAWPCRLVLLAENNLDLLDGGDR